MKKQTTALHPGEILEKVWFPKYALTGNSLAIELRVPANRINEILRGNRAISAETALRLATYFGNQATYWLSLQNEFDLDRAQARIGKAIEKGIQPIT